MKITYELICKILTMANNRQHSALDAYLKISDTEILMDGDIRKEHIETAIKEICND